MPAPFSVSLGRRALVALLSWGATASWVSVATAGNLDAFYLSGDAALQAGAITADSRGGGSVWYNPAGLAELGGLSVDVSVNGYALRFGGSADVDAPNPATQVTRLSSLDLNVVPTALTLTRNFGKVGVGFGVFVPTQSTTILRTQLETPAEGATSALDFSYDYYRRYQEYHIGPALGFRPIDKLNLGFSVLMNYRTLFSMVDSSAGRRGATGSSGFSTHDSLDSQQVGLELTFGGQWQFLPRWSLGLVVRSPAVRLYQIVQTVSTTLVADEDGNPVQTMNADQRSGIDTAVLTPFRFHAGVSHAFDASRVALEGSVQLPFDDKSAGTNTILTVNARAGIRTNFSSTLALGGGVFTDQSPLPKPNEFSQSRLNYYGATLAVDYGTPYGIYAKDGKIYDKPRSLVFGTTVALSYAVGVGQVNRFEIASSSDDLSPRLIPTDVTAHEFTLHIGSTLAE